MDFDFSDDQNSLRDAVRRWVDKGAVRVLVASPAARRLLVMRADVDPSYRTPKRRDGQ